ncbi:hypothetical protein [Calothrix sp. UHCC 0171]
MWVNPDCGLQLVVGKIEMPSIKNMVHVAEILSEID